MVYLQVGFRCPINNNRIPDFETIKPSVEVFSLKDVEVRLLKAGWSFGPPRLPLIWLVMKGSRMNPHLYFILC